MKFLSLAFVLGLLALASGEFTYIEIPPKKKVSGISSTNTKLLLLLLQLRH